MATYQVHLDSFQGPLDLLLTLIQRRQLDITTISLALVTDQFLEYIGSGATITAETLADFVSVGARLLLIKSVALLPRQQLPEPAVDAPEDPTDLTRRLRLYRAFRDAALTIQGRHEKGYRSYRRVPPLHSNPQISRPKPAPLGIPVGVLAESLQRLLQARSAGPAAQEIAREELSVAEAMDWLVTQITSVDVNRLTSFQEMVAGASRARVIVAFLALLELNRLGKLITNQEHPYGAIEVRPAPGLDKGALTSHSPAFTNAFTAPH